MMFKVHGREVELRFDRLAPYFQEFSFDLPGYTAAVVLAVLLAAGLSFVRKGIVKDMDTTMTFLWVVAVVSLALWLWNLIFRSPAWTSPAYIFLVPWIIDPANDFLRQSFFVYLFLKIGEGLLFLRFSKRVVKK